MSTKITIAHRRTELSTCENCGQGRSIGAEPDYHFYVDCFTKDRVFLDINWPPDCRGETAIPLEVFEAMVAHAPEVRAQIASIVEADSDFDAILQNKASKT